VTCSKPATDSTYKRGQIGEQVSHEVARLVRTDQKSFGCLLVRTPYSEGLFKKAKLGIGLDFRSPDKRRGPLVTASRDELAACYCDHDEAVGS
jgi:hypothetical protein